MIVYRRESGLTAADRQQIADDVERLTEKRFPGVVADGATAAPAAAGRAAAAEAQGGAPPAPRTCRRAAAARRRAVPGQPDGYAPFVGPICSADGKAAIVTAYLKGDGESDRCSTRSSSGATPSPTPAAASR